MVKKKQVRDTSFNISIVFLLLGGILIFLGGCIAGYNFLMYNTDVDFAGKLVLSGLLLFAPVWFFIMGSD